jgi:hypothetical protein
MCSTESILSFIDFHLVLSRPLNAVSNQVLLEHHSTSSQATKLLTRTCVRPPRTQLSELERVAKEWSDTAVHEASRCV